MSVPVKRILFRAGAAAALVAAAWFGYDWWTYGRFIASTDDAYIAADLTVIAPKVSGDIKTFNVSENERVQAGDVLFTIDDSDYKAEVDVQQAVVVAARAGLETAIRQVDLQKVAIIQAQADLDSENAEKQRADLDFRRYQSLASSNFSSRQKSDQARADMLKAKAAVDAGEATVLAEKAKLQVAVAQETQAKATIAQALAQLDVAKINLGDTVIRAPSNGVVGNKTTAAGRFVQPGSQVMVMVPLPNVYVTANFKEIQLAHMQQGQKVKISVDALPGQTFHGTVASFAPATGAEFSLLPPENATGNFTKIVQRLPVRITLIASPARLAMLRPGMSVVVDVDTKDAYGQGDGGRGLADGIFGGRGAGANVAAR